MNVTIFSSLTLVASNSSSNVTLAPSLSFARIFTSCVLTVYLSASTFLAISGMLLSGSSRLSTSIKAANSSSAVACSSSYSCGGSANSSGSRENTPLMPAPSSFSFSPACLKSLYSFRRRTSASSGSSSSSASFGGLGSRERDLIYTSVAAMVKNSLAVSMSSSSSSSISERYWFVISDMNMSFISTFACSIRCSNRSSGPSNSFR